MLKEKRYLSCGLIWACLRKNWISDKKAFIAYKQNNGNGFVEHKEEQRLLYMESTGPPITACRDSRAKLWLHVYPQEVVSVFTSKSCVRLPPNPHTHMHTDLLVPIWHLWFILKDILEHPEGSLWLTRAFLQQHALIGGSDKKWGQKSNEVGSCLLWTFAILLLYQTEKLKGNPRGN